MSRKDAETQRNAKIVEENNISGVIVNIAYLIHIRLGPGLFESVYKEVMNYELIKQGIKVDRQKRIPVFGMN